MHLQFTHTNFLLSNHLRQAQELEKRLAEIRAQIKELPGIRQNKEDQLERMDLLRAQIKRKQHIIKKYRNLPF